MYPSTENLLKIRDGEPVDADALACVNADDDARAELERLRRVQRSLQELPAFEPPEDAWERVVEAIDESGPRERAGIRRWPVGAAIAATVAAVAIGLVARQPETTDSLSSGPASIVAETVPTNSIDAIVGTPFYASLVQESARLERALRSVPYQSGVMRAGTASQIAALEDEIAAVYDQLMHADRLGLTGPQRISLEQHRVDLLTALLATRYAQAQR